MKFSVAVLLTCHNRKNKTTRCLNSLQACHLPNDFEEKLDIYLVDDGSTDGTYETIEKDYPEVNLIKGNGKLFWNQGMRLAWKTAQSRKSYDFYIWLNDDVILEEFALTDLMNSYKKSGEPCIIVGACRNSADSQIFSYGGRSEQGTVIPNGKLQNCKYINGNIVLVPKTVYNTLGNLAEEYTHGMGDIDYGLRAIRAGFNNYTTRGYIGICPTNQVPMWSNPRIPFKKRLKLFNDPLGLNYNEYILFRRKFWGKKWRIYAIKAYLKLWIPSLYNKITKLLS